MTVKRQFAENCGDLDAPMDQLVEILTQLLAETTAGETIDATNAAVDLHSENGRAIHVISEDK